MLCINHRGEQEQQKFGTIFRGKGFKLIVIDETEFIGWTPSDWREYFMENLRPRLVPQGKIIIFRCDLKVEVID